MAKTVLEVEYEGTRYHGFQYQKNAPTIQVEMERALHALTGEALRVMGASRTDAGVHARGQVVSFKSRASFAPQVWVRALNYHLPSDIAVRAAWPAGEDFDVRREALSREYRYSIWNRPTRSPLLLRFAYFFPHSLDVEAMQQAARTLEGEHDFASFSPQAHHWAGRTTRRVFKAGVSREDDLVFFDMAANSFLPHQVRHTVGALLQVGRGHLSQEEFAGMVEAGIPGRAGPAAPAHGLCLMYIRYPQARLKGRDENL